MAINQWGEIYHNLKHPRKDLCERLGCKHADKMYVDGEDGEPECVGYIISGEWLTVYRVEPFKKREE